MGVIVVCKEALGTAEMSKQVDTQHCVTACRDRADLLKFCTGVLLCRISFVIN